MDHRKDSLCQMSVSADDRLPGEGSRDEAWFRNSHSRARGQQRRWSERVMPWTRGTWLRHAVGRRSPAHPGAVRQPTWGAWTARVTRFMSHGSSAAKDRPSPPQMTRYLDPVLLWTV